MMKKYRKWINICCIAAITLYAIYGIYLVANSPFIELTAEGGSATYYRPLHFFFITIMSLMVVLVFNVIIDYRVILKRKD